MIGGVLVAAAFVAIMVAAHLSRRSRHVAGGFQVLVRRFEKREDEPWTRVTVSSGAAISLSAETFGIRVVKAIAGNDFDIQIGDPAFDAKVHLRGREDLVVAALHAQARSDVVRLIEMGGEVKVGGDIVVEFPSETIDIARPQPVMIAVAQALTGVRSIPEALAKNALADPEPGVRLRNLELLCGNHRESPAARPAAEAALADPDPRVRLCAALFTKDAAVLRAIAGDASLDGALRAEALRNLRDGDPATVTAALDSGVEALQILALHAAAIARDPAMLEKALSLCAGSDAVAEAAAKALGAFEDPRVQPALIELLRRKAPAVQTAAAWSLGQIGDVDAVEPLLPLAKHSEAARLAIRRCQGRLGAVESGRLSVAEPGESGALSVAAEPGAISLKEK